MNGATLSPGDPGPERLVSGCHVSVVSSNRSARRSVVRGAALTVDRGEMVGLVGESGSGKSLTALSVLRLVPPPGRVTGRVLLDGPGGGDLLTLPEREMRRVRGGRIGFVFQEATAALDPVYTIGSQIAEACAHTAGSRREAREEAVRLLDRVGLPDARRRLDAYPHQLSGGQRQRVDDRHGPRRRPGPAPRRRADHGARRHPAGPDPGAAPGAARRARASPCC